MTDVFDKQKQQTLKGLDHSKKGSFDAPIHDLIVFINTHNDFFTTSSCSGRILVFVESDAKKKGCKWLLSSHEEVPPENVINTIADTDEEAVFKYEPFILHVQCRTLEQAQNMLRAALDCGYRNSGLVIGKKKKFMLAVRSTHGLEVPLIFTQSVKVSDEYIKHLTEKANEKLQENFQRINKFYSALQEMFGVKDDTT